MTGGFPPIFVDRFSRLKAKEYPCLLDFSVIAVFQHSSPFAGNLVIRIKKDEKTTFESGNYTIDFELPGGTEHETDLNIRLHEVKFPEPGQYSVEIVMDDQVVHADVLILE